MNEEILIEKLLVVFEEASPRLGVVRSFRLARTVAEAVRKAVPAGQAVPQGAAEVPTKSFMDTPYVVGGTAAPVSDSAAYTRADVEELQAKHPGAPEIPDDAVARASGKGSFVIADARAAVPRDPWTYGPMAPPRDVAWAAPMPEMRRDNELLPAQLEFADSVKRAGGRWVEAVVRDSTDSIRGSATKSIRRTGRAFQPPGSFEAIQRSRRLFVRWTPEKATGGTTST